VEFARTILAYVRRRCPKKRIAIFANTELEDHRELAALCGSVPDGTVDFFEHWEECTVAIAQWLT
jgi:hypothetical protein